MKQQNFPDQTLSTIDTGVLHTHTHTLKTLKFATIFIVHAEIILISLYILILFQSSAVVMIVQ
jgi:hypothetical protein